MCPRGALPPEHLRTPASVSLEGVQKVLIGSWIKTLLLRQTGSRSNNLDFAESQPVQKDSGRPHRDLPASAHPVLGFDFKIQLSKGSFVLGSGGTYL